MGGHMGYKLLLVVLNLISLSNSAAASDYIKINNRATKLNKSSKCQIIASNPQDICDCCLIKYTKIYNLDDNQAYASCQAKTLCSDQQNITPKRALRKAQRNLNPFQIVDVGSWDNLKLPEDGQLDESDILSILAALTQHKHMPSFIKILLAKNLDSNCIKVKALGEASKGVHTGQLFAISANQACLSKHTREADPAWRVLYIMKESKKGYSELLNLYKVKSSELGQEYINTENIFRQASTYEEYPLARITFEDVHFKLDTKGKTRYFSLLQAAKGKSLQEQITDFAKNIREPAISTENFTREFVKAKTMFYRVGYALSRLHQKYATKSLRKAQKLGKTYIHGDFHAQNVFYDHETGEVSLIDNETFSLALKKRTSGLNDIVDLYLLHTVKTVAHQFAKQLITNPQLGISDIVWHELWHDFFLGYLRAYDFQTQKELLEAFYDFKIKFYECLSNAQLFDSIKNFKDQRVLKRFGPSYRRFYVREHYLNQVFKALEQTIRIENLPQ